MRLVTKVIRVDPHAPDPQMLARVGRALAEGELVAFPTETVYGLGANAFCPQAVARIFEVKGRPSDNPLIVHVASPDEAMQVAEPDCSGRWRELARRFWPGPLSLVLPARPELPRMVTAGLSTVAVRMPRHPVALGLIRAAGRPVAAPSANRSGSPSPSRAEHVLADLEGRVEWVLDGGPCPVGVESTVLDLTTDPPTLLRPGGVCLEALQQAIGPVAVHPAVRVVTEGNGLAGPHGRPSEEPPRSPGMKYRHYAPRAPLWVLEGSPQAVARAVVERLREMGGGCVGLFLTRETAALVEKQLGELGPHVHLFVAGERDRPETVARRLFEGLRALDAAQPRVILAEGLPERGMGLAVTNRLRRASGGKVVRCDELPARTGPHGP